jgi:hypothetical protein
MALVWPSLKGLTADCASLGTERPSFAEGSVVSTTGPVLAQMRAQAEDAIRRLLSKERPQRNARELTSFSWEPFSKI